MIEKGVAAKVLTDDRSSGCWRWPRQQAAANAANEAKASGRRQCRAPGR